MDIIQKAKILEKRNKKIIKLREQGLTYQAIADKFRLSAMGVKLVCDKAGLKKYYK